MNFIESLYQQYMGSSVKISNNDICFKFSFWIFHPRRLCYSFLWELFYNDLMEYKLTGNFSRKSLLSLYFLPIINMSDRQLFPSKNWSNFSRCFSIADEVFCSVLCPPSITFSSVNIEFLRPSPKLLSLFLLHFFFLWSHFAVIEKSLDLFKPMDNCQPSYSELF